MVFNSRKMILHRYLVSFVSKLTGSPLFIKLNTGYSKLLSKLLPSTWRQKSFVVKLLARGVLAKLSNFSFQGGKNMR